MDPVTHAIIGISVAKITGNHLSLSDAASMALVVGAVFPDIDILLQKWGDQVYLKHHRGATHSFPGMVASSVLISVALCFLYKESRFSGLFLWALLGCFSHVFFDIFNAYGAKLLWPFSKKKFSIGLMILFDPVLGIILLGYIFYPGKISNLFLVLFSAYFFLRGWMREHVRWILKRKCGNDFKKINVLPSMMGLFRWHFILETEECNVIGEINTFNRDIKMMQKLYKLKDESVIEKALLSPLGSFFMDFTPLYHIGVETIGEIKRYTFVDMRYYYKDNFLHHAFLEMDESDEVVKSTFNPYSIHREVEI